MSTPAPAAACLVAALLWLACGLGSPAARHISWLRFGGATEALCVRGIAQTDGGMLYLAAESGLYSFDGFHLADLTPFHGHGSYNAIAAAGDSLVAGTNAGLVAFRPSDGTGRLLPYARGERVIGIVVAAGSLWAATTAELYRDGRPVGAATSHIGCLATDGRTIYIGRPDGVYRHDPRTARTTLMAGSPARASCLMAEGGTLWIGTPTGVGKLAGGRYSPLCRAAVAKCLGRTPDGQLAAGTDDGLLLIAADGTAELSRHDTRMPASLPGDAVWCLFTDADGGLWAGTDSGAALLPQAQRISTTTLAQLTGTGLGSRILRTLTDSRGRQWLGGTGGLICIDKGRWRWYRMGDKQWPIVHNRVRCIVEDSSRRIVVGGDMGAMVLDEASGQFVRYIIAEDPTNWVYWMEERGGGLWHITTFAASYTARFDSKTRRLRVQSTLRRGPLEPRRPREDSLLAALGGAWLSASIAPDGRTALLGGKDRFATMRLDDAGGKAHKLSLWNAAGGGPVADSTKYIELRFADFDYAREASPDYEYRLDDGGWIPVAGKSHTLLLPAPAAGSHIVAVREAGGAGAAAELRLYVERPWWGGPWWIALYAAVAASLAWCGWHLVRERRKVRKLAAEGEYLSAQLRLRLQEGEMSDDDKQLRRITKTIDDHLADSSLDVAALAALCGMSEKQLYRKVKALTGMATMAYIRDQRLKKAAALLAMPGCGVQEAMYKCGFQNASHFARIFQKQYGVPPSEYSG